ncbi:MAG: methylase involved in ubiquinone/menaquinone biosynthesis [Clostridium sp. Maddingley MBC34-26]|nr:MAG: methylase involved in ubiquinone/menaquinone biosynthesis [Clostridium sp. Maddingley MBC34-26]
MDLISVNNKNRALDIGCGSGILTFELCKHYGEVIGIDISEEMLSVAKSKRQRDNISYINMDANELCFEKTFDFIVSRTTFHHLFNIQSVLKQMKSMLNEGGKIVILDNVSKVETPPRWAYIVGAFQDFYIALSEIGLQKELERVIGKN